ncbi:concanavalin A-like lectin/glucanase domain-containing protein [Gigaspora rosea]|uniref:Concanavalin A-like lectin/glucanase domain-containing protein n=1 Tax=Gigaspora rosea TaxID=44941 RepID=A0A397URM9_9GLOM|nr:concanavalin A-like lectin/glucanase domain-containing protein [Gigaspora rosea]
MEDLELTTTFDYIVLPGNWEIENKSPFINIDSSGAEVSYTDPDDNKAIIIRANNPIPLECGIFYFEIKVIDKGKNGARIYGKEENGLWGCSYHGDDGYSFYFGSGELYGPTYTTGDIIGCYLNFIKRIVFYTKNGVNLGIACHLPDDLKGIIYPCVGFRSQGGSVKVNFGRETFKYSEEVHFIASRNGNIIVNLVGELTKSLEKKQNIQGHIFFLMGEFDKALDTLTKLLETEPDNIKALRYRGEIYYMMKKYNESIADLKKLLEIKPGDEWATKAYELVETFRCDDE